jgi:ElaB/YqjD/DUF883 family membrane-anchored ribosome-binding protein
MTQAEFKKEIQKQQAAIAAFSVEKRAEEIMKQKYGSIEDIKRECRKKAEMELRQMKAELQIDQREYEHRYGGR